MPPDAARQAFPRIFRDRPGAAGRPAGRAGSPKGGSLKGGSRWGPSPWRRSGTGPGRARPRLDYSLAERARRAMPRARPAPPRPRPEPAPPRDERTDRRAGTVAPAGTTSAAAASDPRDAEIERLHRRVLALES